MTIALAAGDYRLEIDPGLGGSIARLDWRGEPLLRPTCGPSPLDTACFPLVPFSNRIAHGRFEAEGVVVRLAPNMPGGGEPHPLHGFGWLATWQVAHRDTGSAVIVHDHAAGEWPWAYRAEQRFVLDSEGLTVTLSIRNRSAFRMPAGLGFHPYVPVDSTTTYHGLHRGEWLNTHDNLPDRLDWRDAAIDWWDGRPLAARAVDTAYASREGSLTVTRSGVMLIIEPSPELGFTVVYTPQGPHDAYACIEPVSHMTDAINRPGTDNGLKWLGAGEAMAVSMRLSARASD